MQDYIITLLDMKDAILKNIEEDAREITIGLELRQKTQLCPACGVATNRVRDYHHRMIWDLDLRGKRATLHYQCRRYLCHECGKKFAEKCRFVGCNQRFAHRVVEKTVDLLRRHSRFESRRRGYRNPTKRRQPGSECAHRARAESAT